MDKDIWIKIIEVYRKLEQAINIVFDLVLYGYTTDVDPESPLGSANILYELLLDNCKFCDSDEDMEEFDSLLRRSDLSAEEIYKRLFE